MGLRLTLSSISLVLGLSTSALAAEDRLPLAKPASGATTPALKPYDGKLHIQRGVTAPRLKMAPSTPVAPMKPVKVKPARK
jgi:hypothetical protein